MYLPVPADVALMHFFGALDTPSSLPNRSSLNPRTDDRSQRVCRTLGSFAVYMHDYGLDQFDSRVRDDGSCWNVTAANSSQPLLDSCSNTTRNRHYTWWCNKRPNNPCVFGCPNQVCHELFVVLDGPVSKAYLPYCGTLWHLIMSHGDAIHGKRCHPLCAKRCALGAEA
jgi:hypothetical protein